jgi:hypothetical protein
MRKVLTSRQLARSKLVMGLFLFVMCVTITVNYASAEWKMYGTQSGKPYVF